MKNDGVLVSVITVCYNREKTIEKAIQSVINQTYENIEYIIIDGASSDNTLGIINKYKNRITRIISEPDAGIYFAMNKGIDTATGELITFLNGDDEFMVDTVKNAVECYILSNADIVYGDYTTLYNDGSKKEIKFDNVDLSNFHYGFPIPHPGTFVKLDLMKKYRFNTDYRISADYDLFFRMYLDGCTFKHYEYNAVLFSLEGISSVQIDEVSKEDIKIKLKYLNNSVNTSKVFASYFDYIIDRYACVFESIRKLIQDDTRLVVFGCGKEGKRCLNVLKILGIHPIAVIDNDKSRVGSFINYYKIEYAKDYIDKHLDNNYIIATTKFEKELKDELVLSGVTDNNILLYGKMAEEGVKMYLK